jgi:hypothetical protein
MVNSPQRLYAELRLRGQTDDDIVQTILAHEDASEVSKYCCRINFGRREFDSGQQAKESLNVASRVSE